MARTLGVSERPDLPLAVVIGAGAMAVAIARRLGSRYRLLIADKNAGHVQQIVALLRDEGHDTRAVACDITDPVAIEALKRSAFAQGPLAALVHVVGLSPTMGDWRTLMTVNVTAARMVAEAMLPLATSRTAAIFISSSSAHFAKPDPIIDAIVDDPLDPAFLDKFERALGERLDSVQAYCWSKRALNRMCERLAPAWGDVNARIVSLSPGLIATPMGRLEWKHQPLKHEILARTPLSREGTLLEIAAAVEFLASDQASFITGTNLLVDGGASAALQHDPGAPAIG